MIAIPTIEKAVSDEEVFSAFRLETPELSPVRQALESGDNARAKKSLYNTSRTAPMSGISLTTDRSPYRRLTWTGLPISSRPLLALAEA